MSSPLQDPSTVQAMAQRSDIPTPLRPEQWSGNPYNDSYTQQLAKQEMAWHKENNPDMSGGAKGGVVSRVVLNGGKQVFVVRVDKNTKKKYINKNKQMVYLSSIRGKYRYVK